MRKICVLVDENVHKALSVKKIELSCSSLSDAISKIIEQHKENSVVDIPEGIDAVSDMRVELFNTEEQMRLVLDIFSDELKRWRIGMPNPAYKIELAADIETVFMNLNADLKEELFFYKNK